MTSLFTFLNRLLPFATPGTPFIQDLAHLGAVCALLYFAPQIQQWYQAQRARSNGGDEGSTSTGRTASTPLQDDSHPDEHDETTEPAVDAQNDEAIVNNAPIPVEDDAHAQLPVIPGPANPPQPPNLRAVGAKKAKALAKRDQRRAYNESLRIEGEQQRAKDAEGAAEREAALIAERERRKAVEAAIEAKKSKERELKRKTETLERQQEMVRRELAVALVKQALDETGKCDLWRVARRLGEDVDDEWVEKILNATGVLGMKDGLLTIVTSVGWAVRVSHENVARMYREVIENNIGDEQGAVSYDVLGGVLDDVLRRRPQTVSA